MDIKIKPLEFNNLILYEDEHYILINKPPYVSTLEDRQAFGKQNILQLAKKHWPDIQAAHRLDKDTSGVMALAKNPEAYRHLAIQFQKRKVKKIYHAVVSGLQHFENVEVDLPIAPASTGGVKIDRNIGKPARTFFRTLEVFKKHTLVECRPVSGRMHQIRIHLAVLKAPIVGDKIYGGKDVYLSEIKKKFNLKKWTEEEPLIKRFALHAFQLEFTLMNEETLLVEAPYPKDIKALLNQLKANV